ncbi:polysaccharide biosynthesis protein [Cecembia rubra]|uniref:polysaccharide biosynthesis protein n=1 Tax=Cecembia rubra TaxID=1485585 RepID=UPI002715123C|nr:polysaccharide biosynthesis protein [Cecembia rubra]
MVHTILKKIWHYSGLFEKEENYDILVELTQELIILYDQQGRLLENPFESARKRTLSLPVDELKKELKNKVCLVTGGLGSVGTTLVDDLLKFEVSKVFVLDIKPFRFQKRLFYADKVEFIHIDIRDEISLAKCLKKIQPEIVFHTAAVRDPGYAERNILETVQTNIIGTWNLVKACENSISVKNFVFTSTGKASRYFTQEIYASTKKICENILDAFSRTSKIKYSMVRFTHIYCNSLMNNELKNSSKSLDYVKIHSPGKFVTAQNLTEASYLLLNALINAKSKICNFLLVKNLEWPVESLELALYYIKNSGRRIPIVFTGNPKGYSEKFFRGQLDWNKPQELNLLINVYENQKREINKAGDILISSIVPCEKRLLFELIQNLKSSLRPNEQKENLLSGLEKIFIDSLKYVNKKDTFNILKWGISPKFLVAEDTTLENYGHIYPILVNSLVGSEHYEEVQKLLKEAKEIQDFKNENYILKDAS